MRLRSALSLSRQRFACSQQSRYLSAAARHTYAVSHVPLPASARSEEEQAELDDVDENTYCLIRNHVRTRTLRSHHALTRRTLNSSVADAHNMTSRCLFCLHRC